ncbi:hypothetical protein L228DRAFT_249722 [Xylona heveae TC161]|uniref:Uncharacterized protein n=1 Tax=Xylona heveae (strain CBS 132557 / TC161) TaxID=1328760 RepID=A0A165FEK9_XYLHT|nr:hypothetical protein L228DRAFT_249722 [Xylona heveae TC161]KZF20889.1 hypothetical protein L228DRAFT_249722 [Xylona heveae TC161]
MSLAAGSSEESEVEADSGRERERERERESDEQDGSQSLITQRARQQQQQQPQIDPELDNVDRATRYLLHYFSIHVAPATAVIDRGFNGYRDLILPLAETDPLVCKVISVVSTQHMSSRFGHQCTLETTSDTYSELIRDLIIRSHHRPPYTDQSSIVALLLLHLREIISGSDDFKLVYGSLRTLLNAAKDGFVFEYPYSQLGEFLKIQILRVRLFAEALFDETYGAQFLLTYGERCFEFLRFCLRLHPEHQELVANLYELIALACKIYVQRATYNPMVHETAPLIERCKTLSEKVDRYGDITGHHLLGWSYFVVAAESSTADHRVYWMNRLKALHGRTGAPNILKGIEQIQKIWNLKSAIRWTSLLGGPSQALIM